MTMENDTYVDFEKEIVMEMFEEMKDFISEIIFCRKGTTLKMAIHRFANR